MQKLVSLFAAAAIASVTVTPVTAQSNSEIAIPTIDFDQVFNDVLAGSKFNPDISIALYRAALKRINAITYSEWLAVREANYHPALSSPAVEAPQPTTYKP